MFCFIHFIFVIQITSLFISLADNHNRTLNMIIDHIPQSREVNAANRYPKTKHDFTSIDNTSRVIHL